MVLEKFRGMYRFGDLNFMFVQLHCVIAIHRNGLHLVLYDPTYPKDRPQLMPDSDLRGLCNRSSLNVGSVYRVYLLTPTPARTLFTF
jgi:hypothetical protein